MRENKVVRASLFAGLTLAFALCFVGVTNISAQEGGAVGEPPANRELPIKHAPGTKLTDQQTRGAGIFIQRCALCHLDKTFGTGGSKYCCVKSLGPRLQGMFKDIAPEQEKAMRDFIMNGGPTYMPAFKYGLTPKEIDDIIAYLKTLE